ncbi:MAG: hypothetical protein QM811_20060 [Pirellulales bacterium]
MRMRLDPILEPIGMGFAASLNRYFETRKRYPDAELFMGIGNLTELTDADSAAINVLLLGYCQELGIRGVLTTQVVNWARNSVRECDLARRLSAFAVRKRTIPKHREPRLIPLRGDIPRVRRRNARALGGRNSRHELPRLRRARSNARGVVGQHAQRRRSVRALRRVAESRPEES